MAFAVDRAVAAIGPVVGEDQIVVEAEMRSVLLRARAEGKHAERARVKGTLCFEPGQIREANAAHVTSLPPAPRGVFGGYWCLRWNAGTSQSVSNAGNDDDERSRDTGTRVLAGWNG